MSKYSRFSLFTYLKVFASSELGFFSNSLNSDLNSASEKSQSSGILFSEISLKAETIEEASLSLRSIDLISSSVNCKDFKADLNSSGVSETASFKTNGTSLLLEAPLKAGMPVSGVFIVFIWSFSWILSPKNGFAGFFLTLEAEVSRPAPTLAKIPPSRDSGESAM